MITLFDFADQVARMRHKQKLYFATRSQTALAEAKYAEKEIDNMLIEIQKQIDSLNEKLRQHNE